MDGAPEGGEREVETRVRGNGVTESRVGSRLHNLEWLEHNLVVGVTLKCSVASTHEKWRYII